MTFDQFKKLVLQRLPDAEIDEDEDGQIVIYTSLAERQGNIVRFGSYELWRGEEAVMTKYMSECVLCKADIDLTESHNAQPLANGRCCSDCNALAVIPARLGKVAKSTWVEAFESEEASDES